MNYYLIQFQITRGIITDTITRLVIAWTFKDAYEKLQKEFPGACGFENLTIE